MKSLFRIIILALIVTSCTKNYSQIEISGDIQCNSISDVKVFTKAMGEDPMEATLSQDAKG